METPLASLLHAAPEAGPQAVAEAFQRHAATLRRLDVAAEKATTRRLADLDGAGEGTWWSEGVPDAPVAGAFSLTVAASPDGFSRTQVLVSVAGGVWVRTVYADQPQPWREVGQSLTGTEPALVGEAPPAGAPLIQRAFTVHTTVGQNGGVTARFPAAFPHGVTSVVASIQSEFFGWLVRDPAGCSRDQWFWILRDANQNVVAPGTNVSVSVIAAGW